MDMAVRRAPQTGMTPTNFRFSVFEGVLSFFGILTPSYIPREYCGCALQAVVAAGRRELRSTISVVSYGDRRFLFGILRLSLLERRAFQRRSCTEGGGAFKGRLFAGRLWRKLGVATTSVAVVVDPDTDQAANAACQIS
jgi:hypothetical protein